MNRLPLRDELFLLAHHDDGRPRLHERPMNLGLATAQLADLVVGGCLHVMERSVQVHEGGDAGDGLAEEALERVSRIGPPRPIRACLELTGRSLYGRTADALLADGLLARANRRRLGVLPAVRYEADAAVSAQVRGRVRYAVQRFQEADAQCATLCGLLRALRLEETLAINAPSNELLHRLGEIDRNQYPPLADLVDALEIALGRTPPAR
jgi:hypothetical protein